MPSSYFLHSVCRSVFPTFPHPTHQPSKPPSQTQQPCRTPLLVVAAITPWWPMVPASRRQEVDLETSASSSGHAPVSFLVPPRSRAAGTAAAGRERGRGRAPSVQQHPVCGLEYNTTLYHIPPRRGRIPGDWLYDLCVKERDACRYLCLYCSMVMNDATNMRKHCMTNHRQAVMAVREPQAV